MISDNGCQECLTELMKRGRGLPPPPTFLADIDCEPPLSCAVTFHLIKANMLYSTALSLRLHPVTSVTSLSAGSLSLDERIEEVE